MLSTVLSIQLLYFEQEENGGLGLALQVLCLKIPQIFFVIQVTSLQQSSLSNEDENQKATLEDSGPL